MSELELVRLFTRARFHIIVSQFAPTALLGFTVWLAIEDLGKQSLAVKLAAAGILLASGILGALAQFTAASEAEAVARDLSQLDSTSAVSAGVIASAKWLPVVKFVTPAIFVVIFAALMVHLFL